MGCGPVFLGSSLGLGAGVVVVLVTSFGPAGVFTVCFVVVWVTPEEYFVVSVTFV